MVPAVHAVVEMGHHLDRYPGAILQRPAGPLVAVAVFESLLQDDLVRAAVLLAQVGLLMDAEVVYILLGHAVPGKAGAEVLRDKTEDLLFQVDREALCQRDIDPRADEKVD